jgi:hypothetical protein
MTSSQVNAKILIDYKKYLKLKEAEEELFQLKNTMSADKHEEQNKGEQLVGKGISEEKASQESNLKSLVSDFNSEREKDTLPTATTDSNCSASSSAQTLSTVTNNCEENEETLKQEIEENVSEKWKKNAVHVLCILFEKNILTALSDGIVSFNGEKMSSAKFKNYFCAMFSRKRKKHSNESLMNVLENLDLLKFIKTKGDQSDKNDELPINWWFLGE